MDKPERELGFEASYFQEAYKGRYFVSNPPYKVRSYLREIRRFKKDGRLIDMGCGYGSFLEHARTYFDCSGCDVSEHAIAMAKERLPGCSLGVAAVNNFHSSVPYDVVTCFDVLEHIPDLDSALSNIRSNLVDKGILVVVVPVYDTVVGWLVRVLDQDMTHIHKRERQFWVHRLQDQGFRVLAYKGVFRTPVAGRFYLHLMAQWVRSFSPAILLIVSKTS